MSGSAGSVQHGELAYIEATRRAANIESSVAGLRSTAAAVITAVSVSGALLGSQSGAVDDVGVVAAVFSAVSIALCLFAMRPMKVGTWVSVEVLRADGWQRIADEERARMVLARYVEKRNNEAQEVIDDRWWMVQAGGGAGLISLAFWLIAFA